MKTYAEPKRASPVGEGACARAGAPPRATELEGRAGARLGLVIAMRAELPPLFPEPRMRAIETYPGGWGTVGLILSGMGSRRAREAAERLCARFRPDCLVSLGVCGGVADGLAAGDLVVAERVVCGPEQIGLAGPWTDGAIRAARRTGCRVNVGAVQTFGRPVVSRRGVVDTALGVDMESYAVAEAAREHGLPAVVVKAISDMLPARATIRTVAGWLWRFRDGFAVARETLTRFGEAYFRDLSV